MRYKLAFSSMEIYSSMCSAAFFQIQYSPPCDYKYMYSVGNLKVHKNENFFGFDFEFCTISLLIMSKY